MFLCKQMNKCKEALRQLAASGKVRECQAFDPLVELGIAVNDVEELIRVYHQFDEWFRVLDML